MADRTYRIKVVRGDQDFEAEGDKAFVLSMLNRFEGSPAAPPPPPPATKGGKRQPAEAQRPLAPAKGMSVGEFIRQFGFKRHTDLVLAFGYYLEQHGGATDFAAADVNNCYYEAKMESSNTSQMIIQNIRRGYLMEAKGEKGKRRRYTLTRTGEDYLKEALKHKSE
jgi:hypothetical protein